LADKPKALDTIISVGGGLSVRYQSASKLEYGFDVNDQGKWTTYKQTVAASEAIEEDCGIVVIYEPTASGAEMRLIIDGVEQPPVISEDGQASIVTTNNLIGIGNEVHEEAQNRGIVGSFSRAVVTSFEGPFHASLIK